MQDKFGQQQLHQSTDYGNNVPASMDAAGCAMLKRKKQEARSEKQEAKKQKAKSKKQKAKSEKQNARSKKQEAKSKKQKARAIANWTSTPTTTFFL